MLWVPELEIYPVPPSMRQVAVRLREVGRCMHARRCLYLLNSIAVTSAQLVADAAVIACMAPQDRATRHHSLQLNFIMRVNQYST